jgi:hypothetical protein
VTAAVSESTTTETEVREEMADTTEPTAAAKEEIPAQAPAKIPAAKPKRRITFSDAREAQEAAQRHRLALEAMKRVANQKQGRSISKSWKRLPKYCHCMREELCRAIFTCFLDYLHGEMELPKDKNPLTDCEGKHVASLIKGEDAAGLVKYLEETELHIRYGPQRSKVLPDAPLNMRIFANLRQERSDLAKNWGVAQQGLREERIFGLFLRGPFDWPSLRQVLWEADQLPSTEDVHEVTEEEERMHDERIRKLESYQKKIQDEENEELHQMEVEDHHDDVIGKNQVAPEGLIESIHHDKAGESMMIEALFGSGTSG